VPTHATTVPMGLVVVMFWAHDEESVNARRIIIPGRSVLATPIRAHVRDWGFMQITICGFEQKLTEVHYHPFEQRWSVIIDDQML
jgi:hypothetical protein